jgi:hypothetical protein
MAEVLDTIEEQFGPHVKAADERFRKLAGVYLGFVAVVLAITTLASSNADKSIRHAAREADDIYSYYGEKNSRQTAYQLLVVQLETQLVAQHDLPDQVKAKIQETINRYNERIERYESDQGSSRCPR